jgi:hypothetical protein
MSKSINNKCLCIECFKQINKKNIKKHNMTDRHIKNLVRFYKPNFKYNIVSRRTDPDLNLSENELLIKYGLN